MFPQEQPEHLADLQPRRPVPSGELHGDSMAGPTPGHLVVLGQDPRGDLQPVPAWLRKVPTPWAPNTPHKLTVGFLVSKYNEQMKQL